MPSAKPGVHPLEDVLFKGLPVYGPEIDSLIKQLARHVTYRQLESMFDWYAATPLDEFKYELETQLAWLREGALTRYQ